MSQKLEVEKSSDMKSVALLALLLGVFFPGLYFAQTAALTADHWQQHYPWAQHLSESVKQFKLPFWTSTIHCGFPIAAESQIGIFYLPNLLLSFFLPFHWAYSYTSIFHFLVSGWGVYAYARFARLSVLPSLFAAIVFLFGASYGGAYYNITSLKTLCWFPWQLLVLDLFLYQRRFRFVLILSGLLSLSFLAGYLQMACFSLFILGIYAAFRILLFKSSEPRNNFSNLFSKETFFSIAGFSFAVGLATVAALPQLTLTYPLAIASNRTELSEAYAYIGSMPPFALLTFFFPYAQSFFRGNSLYGSLMAVFFVIFAFRSKQARQELFFRLWSVMAITALLLALGQWSPLYVGIVKVSQFYSFRVPAKFLVFFNFYLCLIAARGFQSLLDLRKSPDHFMEQFNKTTRFFSAIAAGTAACWLMGGLLIHFMRPWIYKAGEWFVVKYFVGQPGRPHSIEIYQAKLQAYLDNLSSILSVTHPWTAWAFVLIMIYFVLLRVLPGLSIRFPRGFIALIFVIVIGDLYVHSWMGGGLRGDLASYKSVSEVPALRARLQEEKRKGRVGRIYGFRQPDESLPSIPSANMLDKMADIGAYSPLVGKRYYETVGLFGNVDDSTRMIPPNVEFVIQRLSFLRSLNVTHILSTQELVHPEIELLDREGTTWLYRLQGENAPAYFTEDLEVFEDWESLKNRLLEPFFNPQEVLLLEATPQMQGVEPGLFLNSKLPDTSGLKTRQFTSETEEPFSFSIQTPVPGFFVFNQSHDAGWSVLVNGKPKPVLRAYGMFQAVHLEEPGQYRIVFNYDPWGAFKKKLRGHSL